MAATFLTSSASQPDVHFWGSRGGYHGFFMGSRSQVARSLVQVVSLGVGGDFGLPVVSIVEQLPLVVQQLFRCLGGERKDALHDGIKRVGLLVETTVDIFGHVVVITCGLVALGLASTVMPCAGQTASQSLQVMQHSSRDGIAA